MPTPEPGVAAAHEGRSGFGAVMEIRGAVRLVASSVVGRMPIGMLTLGALLLVQQEYGSFATAGLAVGALAFGAGVAAPLQGALVDLHGAARVLVPVAVGQGVATFAFASSAALGAPRGVVIPLAFFVGVLTPPVSATLRMTWMYVTDHGPVRDAAFALDAMTTQLLFALGPLLTALSVQVAGTVATVILAGGICVAGTLVFTGARPVKVASEIRSRARAVGAERGERFRWAAALSSPGLRVVLITVVLLAGWAGGSIEVGLAALAVDVGSPAAAGVLVGAWCAGGVVGGWFYGRRAWSSPIDTRHRFAALGVALAVLPLLAAESILVALALAFLAGLPWAAVFACQYQMVAEHAPPHALAEAFTWNVSSIILGVAIGNALGGALITNVGLGACFVQTAVVAVGAIVWQHFAMPSASVRERE